jgi:hypothetical protein
MDNTKLDCLGIIFVPSSVTKFFILLNLLITEFISHRSGC